MSNVEIQLISAGVAELLNSAEMTSILQEHAEAVASAAGDGYTVAAPHNTGQRVAINVFADSDEARQDNLANNTLLKCIGG